ncbi:MAG: MFS transporter [Candidatus Thorarchaeota archaeon]|nr:MFS transporter [Candidatus Thorarchaeota archaeon]
MLETPTKMPGTHILILAVGFGTFLGALDSSIVNVSLFTMSMQLGVDMNAIQWVILAYLLVITAFMPLMGKIGDRLGKTRVFQMGMIIFIIGSFFCALSTTLPILVVSRIFQAIGASIMSANGMALITYFTTPQDRGRAIGMISVILAAALGLGPVIGGFLSQYYGWPSIFLVNLPIGVIGYLLMQKYIPETKRVEETKFDMIGATLFFTFLFVLVYYVSIATTAEFVLSVTLISIIVVSFFGFILRESRFSSPIIPTKVLADRRISTSIFSALFAYMGLVPVIFLMPFFLQEALGFTQSITGLFLVVHPLTISITGPVAGFISERVLAKYQTVFGLVVELVGLILLAYAMPNIILMAASVVVLGFGLSLFTVANGNFIMTSSPKQYMGVVSALINISRTTGFSVGTAAVTAIFAFLLLLFNPGGLDSGPEFVLAYTMSVQYAIWFFCTFVVVAIFVSAFRGMTREENDRENGIVNEGPPVLSPYESDSSEQ